MGECLRVLKNIHAHHSVPGKVKGNFVEKVLSFYPSILGMGHRSSGLLADSFVC